jgi:hypothetical protein
MVNIYVCRQRNGFDNVNNAIIACCKQVLSQYKHFGRNCYWYSCEGFMLNWAGRGRIRAGRRLSLSVNRLHDGDVQ